MEIFLNTQAIIKIIKVQIDIESSHINGLLNTNEWFHRP